MSRYVVLHIETCSVQVVWSQGSGNTVGEPSPSIGNAQVGHSGSAGRCGRTVNPGGVHQAGSQVAVVVLHGGSNGGLPAGRQVVQVVVV